MKDQELSPQKAAYLYAIKLLTKRDYSKHKLQLKLKTRGYDEEHIQDAVDEIIEKGYLKEETYTTARVKGLIHKGLHPSFIQTKLEEEHIQITIEEINEVFKEYKVTTRDQILTLLSKKMRSIDFEKDQERMDQLRFKLIRYILTKGHDLEEIKFLFDELISLKSK